MRGVSSIQRRFSTTVGGAIQNYDRFLTRASLARGPGAIRKLIPLVNLPGMISLGGGLPAPDLFPINGLSFSTDPISGGETLELTKEELHAALQYSASLGLPNLTKFLKDHQKRWHLAATVDGGDHAYAWDVCMNTGSMDALFKAFELFADRGDPILVDDPAFPGSLSALQPRGLKLIGVPTDNHGVVPSELRRILEACDPSNKPKAMYTIPTGQNPSGSTLTLDRKREIYKLACEHDIIILEDDPYFYLNYGLDKAPSEGDDDAYQSPSTSSFWSMDTQGRVLRFDSFSKILVPGARLGFVTGPAPLIEKINYHLQATSMHTSGISQAIVLKLLEHWGDDGFKRHARRTQLFYKRRRDAAVESARKHLAGVAEFGVPEAGMFLWIKLKGIDDTKSLIEDKAVAAKVLLVPGEAFSPTGAKSPYVRAAFSTVSPEKIDQAFERLGKLVREHLESSAS